MLNEIIHEIQKKAIKKADIKLAKVDDNNQSFEIEINEKFTVKCDEVGLHTQYIYKAKMYYLKCNRFAFPSFMLDDINEELINQNTGWNEKLKEPRERELNIALLEKFK